VNPTWLYVAAVYALAVWLARRGGVQLRWRIAALFYVLVLLFMFRPMTQQYVNVPVDFVQRLTPWAYVTRTHTSLNPEMNDLALQIVPWAQQVRESWLSGQVPLWNERSGSGYPLLGNSQSSALSLLRLITLPLPLGFAMTAEAAFKILIALTFMFLYGRKRGWSERAGVIAAISYGFCTFLIVWLHFPLVTVACFLPAVFLMIDLLAERVTYRRFLCAAAVWAVMLFGGHPETVSHAFFLAVLYLFWIVFVERPFRWREALRFLFISGAALTIAALLAAPFLAPVMEGIRRSKRFQELQASPNAIGYYSDFPSQVILVEPHFYGQVPMEESWGPAHAESLTGFAGILGVAAWFALLMHVIAERRWRSRECFFVLATPIILGIILAWPVVSTLFHLLFKLAANARLRLLLCFLLAAQIGAVVDLVERRRTRVWLCGTAIAAAMLLALMVYIQFPTPWTKDTAFLAIGPSMLVLLVAAFVPWSMRGRRAAVTSTLALSLLAVVTVNELWEVDLNWNPTVPARLMYPTTPLIRALQDLEKKQPPNAPIRMVATGSMFFPNTPAVYGFEDIRAHDPMSNGRYLGVMRVQGAYDTADYFARWENLQTRMLDYLNVKYVVSTPEAQPADSERYTQVYKGRDGQIFENHDVQPRFFVSENIVLEFRKDQYVHQLAKHADWAHTAVLNRLPVDSDTMRTDLLAGRPESAPKASLKINAAAPTDYRMRVDAPRHVLVVSSIPFWPGWKVQANGKWVEPLLVNGAFLGFTVRPGSTDVRVLYDPVSWKLGVGISLLTLLGLAVGPAAGSRLRRRRAAAARG
jgi:uncharacterized membrane protein YfhO